MCNSPADSTAFRAGVGAVIEVGVNGWSWKREAAKEDSNQDGSRATSATSQGTVTSPDLSQNATTDYYYSRPADIRTTFDWERVQAFLVLCHEKGLVHYLGLLMSAGRLYYCCCPRVSIKALVVLTYSCRRIGGLVLKGTRISPDRLGALGALGPCSGCPLAFL